ncbi:MAG: 1-deoxy-D-xylulose-5-phosphate synthase [Bacilli bacterium]|nr:1-deoxy-D-xylulose-5-phosphate synthase [Bacilli bacterium]
MKELPIKNLGDLKNKSEDELKSLASDIRTHIIETVSKTGGHLSSNLGIVELTIALHKVFDSPKDKIIFDVSHQTYTHKLLTGRLINETNLRKLDGYSGFAKKSESEHDIYEAGHSSTAISAAIGLSYAKEHDDSIGEIVAVIGDASVTNGLSFEALNFLATKPDRKVIIIINDNEMGVSKNVGALAEAFNKIRIKRKHRFAPKVLKNFLFRVKSSIKSFVYPNPNIFSALQFRYFEGIDGHDFNQLNDYLTFAKNAKQSVILHVKTTKGKGYEFAEKDVDGKWHSVLPFDIKTGVIKNSSGQIVGEHLSRTLVQKTVENDKIYVITPAMILGSGLKPYVTSFPEHIIDVGIAEENAAVIASSMAENGLNPIVFMYSTFLQRAYDELLHDVGRTSSPVVFCVDRSGIVADDGDTHQGIYDIAYLSSIPNFTISAPSCIEEAIKLLELGLTKKYGPFVIRYPKCLLQNSSLENFEYGTWNVINKLNNVNIITYGSDVYDIYAMLIKEGLTDKIGLVNARFINPYDKKLMDEIIDVSDKIIVYEQVIKTSSLGSKIKEYLFDKEYNKKYMHFALEDSYLETGKVEELKTKHKIDYKKLLEELKK